MRLAFAVDGGRGYAGAVLRQPALHGPVSVELSLSGGAEADRALGQVARTVSLDHDGEEFLAVGERDGAIGSLQRAHPGQRPVLFHSPYEAAAWSVISARRPAAQGARVRRALSERLGHVFDLDGQRVPAFPQPAALVELDELAGLDGTKMQRLRAVARAALDGELDASRLKRLGPEQSFAELQRLPGIGPFYAGLITLRAAGFADAMMMAPEPKLLAHAARLYGSAMNLEQLTDRAETWRPFRTWATVLIRLAGERGTF